MGAFGYFPTYTLGNLYAAQFYHALSQEKPVLEQEIAQGNLTTVREWLKENIHRHGAVYPAGELCQRVTGEKLNPRFFIEYLKNKFGDLYDF
jgi:carboxypeptidase Taq